MKAGNSRRIHRRGEGQRQNKGESQRMISADR